MAGYYGKLAISWGRTGENAELWPRRVIAREHVDL